MAQNKIGLSKLGLKKEHSVTIIEWNGQQIEVLNYLPIQEKLDLISRIVNQSLDENNFANPARLNIFTIMEILYSYTNITFTAKQRENFLDTYDLFMSTGLWYKIFNVLKENGEYEYIQYTTADVVNEIYKYRDSILGILEAVQSDYKNLDLDATKLQDKIANKENVEFLKEVIDNLGGDLSTN